MCGDDFCMICFFMCIEPNEPKKLACFDVGRVHARTLVPGRLGGVARGKQENTLTSLLHSPLPPPNAHHPPPPRASLSAALAAATAALSSAFLDAATTAARKRA